MLSWALSLLLLPPLLKAEGVLILDPPLGEHMVLQQKKPIRLSGRAQAGVELKAKLAGLSATAQAGADGRWQVELPALAAGGPYRLELQAGQKLIQLNDVLVGEVWLASGQSNMEWALAMDEEGAKELAKPSQPMLRLFNVARQLSGPLQGQWQLCGPESAKNFSAVAYYFGQELQQRLGVPVGLIAAPWSGTPAETWVPLEALKAQPGLPQVLKRWQDRSPAEQRMYTQGWDFELEVRNLRFIPAQVGEAKLVWLGPEAKRPSQAWGAHGQAHGAPGVRADLAPTAQGARYKGNFPSGAWAAASLDFTSDHKPVNLRAYKAVEFEARGNSTFDLALGQPSVQDGDAYAFPAFQTSAEWKSFHLSFADLKQQGWGQRRGLSLEQMDKISFRVLAPNRFPDQPGLLFDTQIRPFEHFSLQGALWYQGESNVARPGEYGLLLKTLIQGWRQALHDADLGFLVAQLPEFGALSAQPQESALAQLRQAQESVLDLPRTGLAVTLGLGEPQDVHPRHKRQVGRRLAWEALGRIYGQTQFSGEGPRLKSWEKVNHSLRLSFENVGQGLHALGGGKLQGFACKTSQGWQWAEAEIKGDEAWVKAPGEETVQTLRYAWADSPQANLAGDLPGLPFEIQTDK